MGFSLKRALAGAVAGAANAVGEIADLQLKEAAAARLREQELADKRMLMGEENELVIQREQRVAEMKEKLAKQKQEESGAAMSTAGAAAEAAGFKPGTQKYDEHVARTLGDYGFKDEAERSTLNARDTRDAALRKESADYQKQHGNAQLALQRDQIRATREAGANSRAEALTLRQQEALAKRLGEAGTFGVTGRDGKMVPYPGGQAIATNVFNNHIAAGYSPSEALKLTEDRFAYLNKNLAIGTPFAEALRNVMMPVTSREVPATTAPSVVAPTKPAAQFQASAPAPVKKGVLEANDTSWANLKLSPAPTKYNKADVRNNTR